MDTELIVPEPIKATNESYLKERAKEMVDPIKSGLNKDELKRVGLIAETISGLELLTPEKEVVLQGQNKEIYDEAWATVVKGAGFPKGEIEVDGLGDYGSMTPEELNVAEKKAKILAKGIALAAINDDHFITNMMLEGNRSKLRNMESSKVDGIWGAVIKEIYPTKLVRQMFALSHTNFKDRPTTVEVLKGYKNEIEKNVLEGSEKKQALKSMDSLIDKKSITRESL